MYRMKKILSMLLAVALIITLIPISSVYADGDSNVDTGDTSDYNTGNGSDKNKYTSNPMGIRVSIYWAPIPTDASTSDKYDYLASTYVDSPKLVQQIGKTTDFVKGVAPSYTVDFYSTSSVFDYMYDGDKSSYRLTSAKVKKYDYISSNDSSYKNLIDDMPNPKDASASDWEKFFTGYVGTSDEAKEKKTYANLSKITEACGQKISTKNLKEGNFIDPVSGKAEVGVYKLFFEPLISAEVNGNGTFWTLKDAEKYATLPANISAGRDMKWLVTYFSKMFEYMANLAYLQYSEPCLNMVANNYDSAGKWLNPTKGKGTPFQINFSSQSKDYIIKQLNSGGKAYRGLGCGVISPQRDGMTVSDKLKVIVTYVKADLQETGAFSLKQLGTVSSDYINRDGLENLLTSDVASTPYGDGYLNDILSSPVDLTEKTTLKNVKWEDGMPRNESTNKEIEPTADDIWSYALGLRLRLIYAAENGIVANTNFEEYLDLMEQFEKLNKKLKSASASEKVQINLERQNVFNEALSCIGFGDTYTYYKGLVNKPDTALKFLQYILGKVDVTGLYSKATYIKDVDDIKLDSVLKDGEDGVIYLRYIVVQEPKQVNVINTFKDGDLVSTVALPAQSLVSAQRVEGNTIKVDVSKLKDITTQKAYTEAKFVKVTTAKGSLLTKMPTNPIKTINSFGPITGLDIGENIYVEWRIDKKTPVDGELNVPEWRLSKNDSDMKYSDTAIMSLKLTQDAGHKAYWSTLSPSGTYKYDTINPNGKITTTANTPANMKYSDWLHSKAKTKGSYSISHSSPNVSVDVAGILNAIKSTDLTGINIASWTVSSSDKSTLADYDLSTGLKSTFKDKENPSITKSDTLSYSIKNKDTYSHNYGYYSHYTVHVADSDPKDKIDDSYSYDVCNCTTIPETPSASYVSADYKIRVILDRYKATSNSSDILKVKAAKKEDNGKTTITKQNASYLTIYPEIPMLFSDDSGKDSIFFAAGTQSRKITAVDYHTLEYTAYVDATVTGTQVTDSRAKTKAKAIGLGSNPVFAKGTPLQISYKVNESKGSKNAGLLTVKSYALDIDNDTLKSTWGNEDYNPKVAHTSLLSSFNNFSSGTATEKLEIAVPNGTNVAYTGALVKNKLSYKEKDNLSVKHTLTVRGGVLTEVDGKTVANIKANDNDLYNALVGMKLVGTKDETVLRTLVSEAGDKLTESSFATLANKERGVSDISTGKGWYFEDTTTLIVMEYTTTYELPISGFTDRIPMTVKGLETPINKAQFFDKISKGYNVLNYSMSSKSISGLGVVKVYFEHNSRTGSDFGPKEPAYGVSNTTTLDSTSGF